MSVEALFWATKLKVPAFPKLCIIYLADHANDRGVCWPRKSRLAALAPMSIGEVSRCLKKLEAWGLIEIEHRFHPNGVTPRSSLYRLRLDRVAPPDAMPKKDPNKGQSQGNPPPEEDEESDEIPEACEDESEGSAPVESTPRTHAESTGRTHDESTGGLTMSPPNRNYQLEPSPLYPPAPRPEQSPARPNAPPSLAGSSTAASEASMEQNAAAAVSSNAAGSAGQENATATDPESDEFKRDQFSQLVGYWQQANLIRFAGDQTAAWKFFREMLLIDRLEAVTKAWNYLLGAKAQFADWQTKDRKDRSRQAPKVATIKEYLGTKIFKLVGMPKAPPAAPKPISAAWIAAVKGGRRSQFDEGTFFAAHDSDQFAAWIAAERRAGVIPTGAQQFRRRDPNDENKIIWSGRGRFFVSELPPLESDFTDQRNEERIAS